jgi:hypothetical protein
LRNQCGHVTIGTGLLREASGVRRHIARVAGVSRVSRVPARRGSPREPEEDRGQHAQPMAGDGRLAGMNDDPRAELPIAKRRPAGRIRAPGGRPRPVVEPSLVYEPPPPPRRLGGDPSLRKDLGLLVFLAAAVVTGIIGWNVSGALTREALAPRPSPTGAALPASARPTHLPTPTPATDPSASAAATATPGATAAPTPTPRPERRPVDVRIEDRPVAAFVTEKEVTWCAAAAVQITLNVNGPAARIDRSRAFQAEIRKLQVALTTRRDSRNGGAGPLGMVASLERLGKVDYELRIYPTRAAALRGAAKAIGETRHAAILLAWRGAHAWVMTGYRADADPTVFANATISGAYILDPWYPRVSSIWGPSDGPGVYQNAAEMRRNFLPWRRPEGRYPGRDGQFLVLIPAS